MHKEFNTSSDNSIEMFSLSIVLSAVQAPSDEKSTAEIIRDAVILLLWPQLVCSTDLHLRR